jgi:O-antigen/teichoic acid export membrane protein
MNTKPPAEPPRMTASRSTGKRNLLTNALVSCTGFGAQVAVTMWLAPFLLHGLGDRRYGIWALVESVLAYLMLFDLGVAASVVRYVAKFEAVRDRDSLNRVFSASICIFTVAGAVVLVVAGGFALAGSLVLPLPADLEAEGRWMLVLLGLNLAVGLPLGVYPCILDGLGRYPAKTAIRTIGLLVRVPLFLTVVSHRGGLVELGWVITITNLAEHLALAFVAHRYLPGLRFSFALTDRATFRTIRGYSLDALLAMVAGRLSFQTDAIVIGAFVDLEHIAFFAVAAKLVEYAKAALRNATTVLVPAVSTLEAQGDIAGIRKVLVDTTRYVVWLILPIQLGLLLLGKAFLVCWLGSRRHADLINPTLIILALPLALALAQSVLGRILYGIGRLRWFARAMMAEALVNLGLSILLVGPLGIEGVAWGTTLPNLVSNLAVAVYVCRALDVPFRTYLRRAFLAPVLVAVPLACAWWAAAATCDLSSWTALLAAGTAGLALYLAAAALIEFGPRTFARHATALRRRQPLNQNSFPPKGHWGTVLGEQSFVEEGCDVTRSAAGVARNRL